MSVDMRNLPAKMQNNIQLTKCRIPDLDPNCWTWTAYISDGYGRFYYQRRTWSTHRLAYELLVGPILDGLTLDHLCLSRPCCNPAHLEPVTLRENIRRAHDNNWAVYGSYFPHFDRLTEYAQSQPRGSLSRADYARLRRLAVSGRGLA